MGASAGAPRTKNKRLRQDSTLTRFRHKTAMKRRLVGALGKIVPKVYNLTFPTPSLVRFDPGRPLWQDLVELVLRLRTRRSGVRLPPGAALLSTRLNLIHRRDVRP